MICNAMLYTHVTVHYITEPTLSYYCTALHCTALHFDRLKMVVVLCSTECSFKTRCIDLC